MGFSGVKSRGGLEHLPRLTMVKGRASLLLLRTFRGSRYRERYGCSFKIHALQYKKWAFSDYR
jgi:hypothetical protein